MNQGRSSTMIEILKPPADLRAYRVVILPNGITAMLISEAFYLPTKKSKGKKRHQHEEMEVVQEFTQEEYNDGEASAALCIGIGSFSDLPEIPGFAHFMEHMVFMGSKKYPKENHWDEFLSKSRGETNAWTDCERTCFFFVVQQIEFVKAMKVFAQFFISPLFNKSSVDREIMAVDNEMLMMSSNDSERARSVMSLECVEEGHPMKKFMAGNKKSLKDDPAKKKINVYEKLQSFYRRMYSAQYMTLVVHSMEPLDRIESQIVKIFSNIPNNNIPMPKFIKPPFKEKNFNKVIRIVPNEDVHKMDIVWSLPSLVNHYRARVVEFLSLLLGHEGKGSILSVLRKRHLALEMYGGNDMTGFTHNSSWTALILSVKLTKFGMENFEQVLEVIYQYINLLEQHLPAHVFEEQKHIEETRYIFKEQESIYSYVEELAENMHMFPPEHYLCGRTLYFDYNEQLLHDCLGCLKPQAMLVILYNKAFNSGWKLKEEPWLSVKYNITDVGTSCLSRLNNIGLSPELCLPAPNKYIATDFSLTKSGKVTEFPVVVYKTVGCRCWYKKDRTFESRNVFVHFNFISTAISKTETNVAIADIMLTCFLQILTEMLYSATLAGYEYSVEGTPEGVVFSINGYSEKIQLVVEDSLEALKTMKINEKTFESVVAHLKQVYINDLMKPCEQAKAVRYSLLEREDPSLIKRHEQISSITHGMVVQFLAEFFKTMFVECFITGNIVPSGAVAIAKKACTLIKKPLPENQIPTPVVMELPVGVAKCLMRSVNSEDTNSCVSQYFQQGPGTIRGVCLNDVLTAAMTEPLFNSLRTEKQLGYSVYCHSINTHGVLGFHLVVECHANRFNMKVVDDHMSDFLEEFYNMLLDMSTNEIAEIIRDQAVLRTYEDGDLYDQSHRFWGEILKHSYVFNRNELESVAFEDLGPNDLIEWCADLISPEKRKLSLMVEGCSKSKCSFATGDVNLGPLGGLIRGIKSCRYMPQSGEAESNAGKVGSPQDHGTNYITNICEFKSRLKPIPPNVIR